MRPRSVEILPLGCYLIVVDRWLSSGIGPKVQARTESQRLATPKKQDIDRLSTRTSTEVRVQLPHRSGESRVLAQRCFDLAAGVQDGAMVAPAEVGSDLLERQRC